MINSWYWYHIVPYDTIWFLYDSYIRVTFLCGSFHGVSFMDPWRIGETPHSRQHGDMKVIASGLSRISLRSCWCLAHMPQTTCCWIMCTFFTWAMAWMLVQVPLFCCAISVNLASIETWMTDWNMPTLPLMHGAKSTRLQPKREPHLLMVFRCNPLVSSA